MNAVLERLALIRSRLFDRQWWADAAKRAVNTVVAVVLPYLGGAVLADIPWLTIISAGLVAFVASIATSLSGLPETEGVDLPWWLAALERVVKTFFQAIAAGILPGALLSSVDWPFILQGAAIAALITLLRLILATLPADPTRERPARVVVENRTANYEVHTHIAEPVGRGETPVDDIVDRQDVSG